MSQTFPRSRSNRPGYKVDEVEKFLAAARIAYSAEPGDTGTVVTAESIRHMAFGLEKGGYSTLAVDAALERLEEAFAARERDKASSSLGEEAWFAGARERAREVLARLERPAAHRFRGSGAFTLGYDKRDVDAFSERLISYFREGSPVTVDDVRQVSFRSRTRGYSEAQVDLVLDAVIDVMLSVR
ncbi:DivIVA domain-containing protein [Agreia sp.]|uniref:DivIVA domain-containing protein n=1 Tax=Agreia sp. TaxID=1872416 RepID=UPI0035BC57B7